MSDYDDYDYNNYDYQQNMDVEDNEEIEIENNFNRAEDEWRTNPEEAFHLFNSVIEKEAVKEPNERKFSFKSYTCLILMSIQKPEQDGIDSYITGFLELLNRQFKSEGDKALKDVVDSLMKSNNPHLISTILPSLLDQLKNMNQISIYCSASMKMCKDYYLKRNAQKLQETLQSVESCIQTSVIQDEDRKKSFIAELLAYKVLYFTMTKQTNQIKALYRLLLKANTDLLEPYIVGVINMTIGQQRALERQYEHSRKKLMDAFYNFQDASSPEAKQSLIYGSVVSILENFKMNLFDDMRSKVYDNDPEIQMFKDLRAAYEHQNVSVFSNIINQDVFQNDPFLSLLKPYMQQIIVECKILRYSKCYRTIKLDYLAKQLMIDVSVVQKYIQGLITKRQLNCLIDEIGGFIEIRHEVSENQTNALKVLVDQIKNLDIN